MTSKSLIELMPQSLFDEISIETNINNQVKKLDGDFIFKLILFSMLDTDKLSLRVMETYLSSSKFRSQLKVAASVADCKYSSIRDRICNIEATYFERLFVEVFKLYNKQLKRMHM